MAGYETARAGWRRPTLRQRLGALGLTIALELLLLLIVLALGGSEVRRRLAAGASTAVVFVSNPADPAPLPSPQQSAPKAAAVPTAPAPRPIPPPLLPAAPQALPFVPVSKSDLAAGDIAKLGSAAGAAAAPGPAKAAAGPGEGPGGVTLYNAEWVVEPSDAQLRLYLPKEVAPGSWALIACQTIAHNRVENCAQLGEAPRGSGLSKAMRLAAWQFQIRPPRIDGKPMVGEWVRIRIEFGKDGKAD